MSRAKRPLNGRHREGGKSPVTFVPHVRESTPRCVGLKNISSAQKQAQYMPVQHTAHPNSPKVREGKRQPDYLKLSKHAFAARPRKHWRGRGSIDFLNNLTAAAAPKFTKREARAKRLPLAGDAAGDLSSGGGGRGMDVGERSGWSCRRVRHGRGPPSARRRPHPLPR